MEEQDDGVEAMESSSTSSWLAAEGTLEQSVKVVGESEDAIYTAGETSRLVLVPPPSSSSSSEKEPCELTVTFQHRLGHVHQIYVISTARICEIYGQQEQDGDREYVCTVRGDVISLSDDEGSGDDVSEGLPETAEQEDSTIEDFNSNINSLVPPVIPALESGKEVQERISRSPEVFSMDSSQPVDDSPSLTTGDSKEELFRSFTEAINGGDVDESIIFEESLDHANWVECPHSPMKSSMCASDDETEVDASTSGFYLIDTDVESQHSDQPQVRLFTDTIRASGKNSISQSLETVNTGSSGHSSWQEAIEESILEKNLADTISPGRSNPKWNSGEEHKVEESSETPWAQTEEFADDFNGENLPGSGFCVFEVNQDHDSSSSSVSKSTPGKGTTEIDVLSNQLAQASTAECSAQSNGSMESRFPVEAPVFECEVSLVDADAWTSVTIRLLSIKSKSQVEIHRVVVTSTPGPSIQPRPTTRKGSFQQGAGTSSLLAMLVPGMLQMVRGMSETSMVKNSSVAGAEKEIGGSDGSPSKVTNSKSSSLPANLPTVQSIAPDPVKMNKNGIPPLVDKNLNCEVEEQIPTLGDILHSNSRGTPSLESVAHGESQIVNGEGSEDCEETRSANIETGYLGAHQKEDRVDEVVQRLDRLETICLRMETSLNAALENMDRRLKLLESSGVGRLPPALGHSIWGPGFDSGSFVSATSVYVPAAHMGPETPSLMDSQIPFSVGSGVDVPLGENSTKGVSSTATPVYRALLSSTSPPSLSAAVPSWPLASWPKNVSPDSSSHSGFPASFISRSGLLNRSNGSLNGSDHPSNGGETFWETRSSEESESDISSDSEQTSYAEDCEDPACGCCPESLSSSPTKPAQLVDNALASALSAFSASFEAKSRSFSKECYHSEEGSDEEGSFTSEEQVPLVELDSFPAYYENEEVVHADAETVLSHGYEAIPLSGDKDIGDLSRSKVILEDSFWSSEIEENQEINWEDEGFQTQEERIFCALEDCDNQAEEASSAFQSSSAVFIQISDLPSLPETKSDDAFTADLERLIQKYASKETKEGDVVGAALEHQGQELQQNPFLQELIAGGDRKVRGIQSSWHDQRWDGDQAEIAKNVLSSFLAHDQSWTGDQAEIAKNVLSSFFGHDQSWTGDEAEFAKNGLSSFLTVRDLSNPLGSNEEMLFQGLFPDEWDWFTSEISPFSSLVEVRDLSEEDLPEKEPVLVQKEAVTLLDGISSKASLSRLEPWSLLDDDVPMPVTTEKYGRDASEQDCPGQKSQWSLLDELNCEDQLNAAGAQDDSYRNREPRSLLDEDIPLASSKVPDVDQAARLYSSHESLLDNFTDVFRSSKHVHMSYSPSSEASNSNPFEDEQRATSDFSQGGNDVPLVLLEDFEGVVHQFEAPGSEGTQSLMFHMSL